MADENASMAEIRQALRQRADRDAIRAMRANEHRRRLRLALRQLPAWVGRAVPRVLGSCALVMRAIGAALGSTPGALVGALRASRALAAALQQSSQRLTSHRVSKEAAASPVPSFVDITSARETELEQLELRQLAARDERLGPLHLDVGLLARIVAARFRGRGKYEQALALYERAYVIFERYYGPNHSEIAAIATDLAEVHQDLGHIEEATWWNVRAAELFGRKVGRSTGAAAETDLERGAPTR